MYYGKMGFTYNDLWNLPTHIRRYFYLKLVDIKKKEHEAEQKEADRIKSSIKR
jgi:phage-related protein